MPAMSRLPLLGPVVRRLHASTDDRIARRLDVVLVELEERTREAERVAARLEARVEELDQVVQRLAPHIASLEVRFEDRRIEELIDGTPAADGQAAALTDAVLSEHRRVGARLAAVSHFEERLRRLERHVR